MKSKKQAEAMGLFAMSSRHSLQHLSFTSNCSSPEAKYKQIGLLLSTGEIVIYHEGIAA